MPDQATTEVGGGSRRNRDFPRAWHDICAGDELLLDQTARNRESDILIWHSNPRDRVRSRRRRSSACEGRRRARGGRDESAQHRSVFQDDGQHSTNENGEQDLRGRAVHATSAL